MNDWIEIPRKALPAKSKIAPDAVTVGVALGPRLSTVVTIKLGAAVAQKLRWRDGEALRIQWGGREPKIKIDAAPADHAAPWALRANKKRTAFTLKTAALPERFGRTPVKPAPMQIEVIDAAPVRGAAGPGTLVISLPRDFYGKAP